MDLKEFLQDEASPELKDVIRVAIGRSKADGTTFRLAHLTDALLDSSAVRARISEDMRLRAKAALAAQIARFPVSAAGDGGRVDFSISSLVDPAVALASDSGADRVTPLTLLTASLTAGLLREPESVRTQESLRGAGLTVEGLIPGRRTNQTPLADFTYRSLGFGEDLTAKARAGAWQDCPLVGMDRELRRLVMSVSYGGVSIVIVGEPGVGKSSLIDGLAYHIAHRTRPLIPPPLDSWTIVMISTMNLLAGTGGRGELEQRLGQMLSFFRKNPTVIPFFDEIHHLLDTADPSARAVATAIKPPMASGQFRCLGATTDREYARFIASDEALNSRFTKVMIPEPDESTTVQIVQGVLNNLIPTQVRDMGVSLGDEAVRTAIRLTSRYQGTESQPRKSIQLLRNVVAEKAYAVQIGGAKTNPIISNADVASALSEIVNVPPDDLLEDRADFYLRLRDHLLGRVIGQAPAIEAVTSWLALHARGWVNPQRPRGRFLFLGPPGVGKTQLALALAQEVMKDRGSLIRKDMGEYKGEGARNRFMGADPGYVGFKETQTLHAQVMMRKYSVVVLDEFEKAHASLSDVLLSILDGRGEDSQGRVVDFSQCIFVLTSNAICSEFQGRVDEEFLRGKLRELGGIWQPPLVDRIDRIVLFQPLDKDALLKILDMMIQDVRHSAVYALPELIDATETRETIVAWATEGEKVPSARRLERAMLRWLTEQSSGSPVVRQGAAGLAASP